MCGICGLIVPEGGVLPDANVLDSMNAALAKRGPDGSGIRTFPYENGGGAILMHRRLAVIDLETGEQPMSNEDGSVWVVFNGEIYNFHALRSELEARGHVFRTRSDTEVIPHLYEEYGQTCVDKLRGMFAFALYDVKKRELFLARDRFGKKPLYYAMIGGVFAFASELKSLLAHPGCPRKVNLEALGHYLTLQYVPDPLTAFEGIYKLPPAHRLTWADGEFRTGLYWNLVYEPKLEGSEEALIEELRERVTEAVRLRLISDVPLGAHLSGGIDSSILTALMAGMCDQPVRTFSIGFKEEAFSETDKARAVARMYGTEHREFVVGHSNAMEVMDAAAKSFDEPFADPSALAVWHLSRMTREYVTVAINGDGGDEIFAGYQRYWLDPWANAYAKLPDLVTQRMAPFLLRGLTESPDKPVEKNYAAGLKRLSQAASVGGKASIVRWGSYFSPAMKAELVRPAARRLLRADTVALLSRLFDGARAASSLDRTLSVDVSSYLPGDLLVKADRMSMAHSLEGRSPLLDQDLAEWAARLPCRDKMRGRKGKYLLRKAFAHLLPEEVTAQKKQGFGLPVGKWFREDLRECAHDMLLSGRAARELFRPEVVQRMLNEHDLGGVDHGKRMYALMMLEIWLEAYKPSIDL
jgi:asparagine synthase (glutamine-hydrolysing)